MSGTRAPWLWQLPVFAVFFYFDPHFLESEWQGCHVVEALGAECVLVKNIKWFHRELQPSNQSKDFPCAIFVACTNTNPLLFLSFSRWLDGPKRKRKNSQCSVKSMSGKMSHKRHWCSCLELQQYAFPSSVLPEYITDCTFLRNTRETLRERRVFSCPVILLASTPASVSSIDLLLCDVLVILLQDILTHVKAIVLPG